MAAGLLSMLLRQGKIDARGAAIPEGISAFTPEVVEERMGVKASVLAALAHHFARARRPLALAEGMAISDPNALETAIAANLLCAASPGKNDLLDFSNAISLGQAAPASEHVGAQGPHGSRRGRRSGLLRGQPRVQPACLLGI